MQLLCIQTCKIPKRGFVEKGARVDLEIVKYDLKAHPWLKFFKAPDAPVKTDEAKDKLFK